MAQKYCATWFSSNEKQDQNQLHLNVPFSPCTEPVIARNSGWFIVLFAPVAICLSNNNYFGTGFLTVIWKCSMTKKVWLRFVPPGPSGFPCSSQFFLDSSFVNLRTDFSSSEWVYNIQHNKKTIKATTTTTKNKKKIRWHMNNFFSILTPLFES